MVYRLWRRWCHGDFTTSQWEQLSYRLEKLRQFEDGNPAFGEIPI